MNEPSLPFPEGPPTEEAHFHIVTDCTGPASHLYQGTVDSAIVHLFFATKGDVHRGSSLIPAKCPEVFDIVSLIPMSHSRFYSQVKDECTNGTTSRACWQESSDRNRLEWLSHLSDDRWRPLREIVAAPFFDRYVLFLPYRKPTPLLPCSGPPCGILRFSQAIASVLLGSISQENPGYRPVSSPLGPIPKDTYLWELNGLLSLDTVTDSTISTIMPHPSQGLDLVPRLMTGPARFVNHCCRPNAELFRLPSRPDYVVRMIEDIDANSEITVGYGPTFWGTGACLCYVCSPTPPILSTSLVGGAGCSVAKESSPAAQTPFAYHFSVVETHTEVNMTKKKRKVKPPLDEGSLYIQFFEMTGRRFLQNKITGIRRSIILADGLSVYHIRLDSDTQYSYRSNPARFVTQSNKPTEKYYEGTASSCGWDPFPIDPVHQKAINGMRSRIKRGPIEWPGASEIVETPVPSGKKSNSHR